MTSPKGLSSEQQLLVALPVHQHGSRSLIGLLVSLNDLARKLYKLIGSLVERQGIGDPLEIFPFHPSYFLFILSVASY
jgi:hypothetical protein